jgi:CoA-transferase family III
MTGERAAGARAGESDGSGRDRAWLQRIWSMLDGEPDRTRRVRLTGPGGLLPAAFDVDALATASVAAATLAVAELGAHRLRTAVPEVVVDRVAAAAAFRSEALVSPQGWTLPPVWDPIAGDYRAAGGWIRLHTNYAHHRAAALRALELDDVADLPAATVADRIAALDPEALADLEERVVAAGGCAAVLHTEAQWRRHPHGSTVADEPPVRLTRLPSPPEPGRPKPGIGREPRTGWETTSSGGGPLAGIRVLDLTRVMAGPVCTRTLAAWGAEVLRIDPPGFEEVPALLPEMTAGKHCAALDLRSDDGRARFAALVGEADVVVHGLRPGALERLGLGDAELRRINPGVCLAAVDAYGWTGPWAGRRGFDSLVQFSCGIAAAGRAEDEGRPVPLPAQALDHATGYLLAAAVGRGLSGRYEGRPPAGIRASLVGTANLLMTAATPRPGAPADPAPADPAPAESAPVDPAPIDLGRSRARRDTAWGPVLAVEPPGAIGSTTGRWRVPAGPLGRNPPSFTV